MVLDKKKATSSIVAGVDRKSKGFMSKVLIFAENLEAKHFADWSGQWESHRFRERTEGVAPSKQGMIQ